LRPQITGLENVGLVFAGWSVNNPKQLLQVSEGNAPLFKTSDEFTESENVHESAVS
jgi:hypothetical protein